MWRRQTAPQRTPARVSRNPAAAQYQLALVEYGALARRHGSLWLIETDFDLRGIAGTGAGLRQRQRACCGSLPPPRSGSSGAAMEIQFTSRATRPPRSRSSLCPDDHALAGDRSESHTAARGRRCPSPFLCPTVSDARRNARRSRLPSGDDLAARA